MCALSWGDPVLKFQELTSSLKEQGCNGSDPQEMTVFSVSSKQLNCLQTRAVYMYVYYYNTLCFTIGFEAPSQQEE